MKKILTAAFAILVFAGCHKNDQRIDKAVLLGFDKSDCVCCGGMVMAFGDSAVPGAVFPVSHMPPGTDIGPGTEFPVKVFIEWKQDTSFCGTRQINITALFRR